MTHVRSCCCGEGNSNDCLNGEALEGCFLVSISGVAPASCRRLLSTFIEQEIADLSVAIQFTVQYDGSGGSNTRVATGLPITLRIDNYSPQTGQLGDSAIYCTATVTLRISCVQDEWRYGVTLSVDPPCDAPDGWLTQFDGVFGGRLFPNTFVPIGQSIPNANSNQFGCNFAGLGGQATVTRIGDCVTPESNLYARSCDGNELITVDPGTQQQGTTAVLYQNKLYKLTSDFSDEEAVDVVWTSNRCEDPILYPVLVRCDGQSGEITYDPALRPSGVQTAVFQGSSWFDSGEQSSALPETVLWSPDECIDSNGDLLELCGSGPLPSHLRAELPEGVSIIEFERLGDEYQIEDQRFCRDIYRVRYQRVVDDGRDAPTVSQFTNVFKCRNPFRVLARAVCRYISDGDAGNPTLPGSLNIQGRGTDRPTYPIADDFDPVREAKALQQGGDCGCSGYTYNG